MTSQDQRPLSPMMPFKKVPDVRTIGNLPTHKPGADQTDYALPGSSSKRSIDRPSATPNKRTRIGNSPFSSSPVDVPSLTNNQRAPVLRSPSPVADENQSSYVGSSVPTQPYTDQERAHHDRRVEINQSRARQLKAYILEAAEKLKRENYDWMAEPIIALIQPMLSYVAMHEDRFDEQIGGLVAVNERISETVADINNGLVELTTRVTGREECLDVMKMDVTGMKKHIDGIKTDMTHLRYEVNERMSSIENKLDTYMLCMDQKLNALLLAITPCPTSGE